MRETRDDSPPAGATPTTRARRRAAAAVGIVLAALLVVELAAPAVYRLTHGGPFPADAVARRLQTPGSIQQLEDPAGRRLPDTVSGKDLHPYVGFAQRHGLGFTSPDPLLDREPGVVNVVVTGGSFAEGIFHHAGDHLRRRLAEDVPAYRGRRVALVALTMGGFKQPQQLMALAWCLVLGAEYDLVLNVDGFNEVALPWAENLPNRVATSYPRSWHMYALKGFDPGATLALAEVFERQRRRERTRRLFSSPPLSWSRYLMQLWDALDRKALDDIREAYVRWVEVASGLGADDGPAFGPYRDFPSDDAAFEALAEEWARSSLQLGRLASANGARYVHALQPNQYVPGSKPMGPDERRVAIFKGPYGYRDAVLSGYPRLAQAGRRLEESGVEFLDLRFLFADEPRQVWSDSCCHLNAFGYHLVVDAIVGALAAEETGAAAAAPVE